MLRENSMVQNAAAELRNVFTAEAPEAAQVEAAFESFGNAIAATVLADYESAHGDQQVLMQRGFRVLTSEEKSFYQSVIKAGKEKTVQTMNGLLSDKVMPITIIEDVYRDLQAEHPLLAAINFVNVQYLTRWVLSDHAVPTATWGAINSTVATQIEGAFRTVDMVQAKLSAFAVIEMDMLDLGPVFLDNYIRTFLKESIYVGLEAGIVAGTGKNQPLGLDRDIHHGVTVSDGVYPQKTAVALTSFMPKEYGAVLAQLAVTEVWYTQDSSGNVVPKNSTSANADGSPKSGYTKHGGFIRNFDEVTLICNQVDFLSKIMPATTVLNAAGGFTKDVFPFPTQVIRSSAVATGKAILCLPKEYFMGVGSGKEGTLTFSDDFKFLEDKRTFKIKLHGMGTAYDDTCAVLLDISDLEEAFITVKNVSDEVVSA